jgi:hypothetical protein
MKMFIAAKGSHGRGKFIEIVLHGAVVKIGHCSGIRSLVFSYSKKNMKSEGKYK